MADQRNTDQRNTDQRNTDERITDEGSVAERKEGGRETPCPPTVVEQVPWLLNGTLEPRDRDLVLAHLATCPSCRRHLEESRVIGDAAAMHLPIELIVDAAEGRTMSAEDRALVEAHVESCDQCLSEWTALQASILATDSMPSATTPPRVLTDAVPESPVWRPLAIAATFAALALGLAWWSSVATPRETVSPVAGEAEIEATVAVITAELLPEASTRATDAAPPATASLTSDTRFVALMLLPTLVPTATFELVIEADGDLGSGDAAVVWRFAEVDPDPTGAVTVLLPKDALRPGDYTLRLTDRNEDGTGPQERFRVRIVGSAAEPGF